MAEDFSTEVARARAMELDAEEARTNAKWMDARADNNIEYGKELVADLEVISMRRQALNAEYQRYAQRSQPPPPRRADAWTTKRSDEMDYEDAYNMLNQTSENAKLGGGISREEYIENIRRLQREKAAGYRQS